MKHNVEVLVSRPDDHDMVRCKQIGVCERLMRLLFGNMRRLWIIIPNYTVGAVKISEIPEGGENIE